MAATVVLVQIAVKAFPGRNSSAREQAEMEQEPTDLGEVWRSRERLRARQNLEIRNSGRRDNPNWSTDEADARE